MSFIDGIPGSILSLVTEFQHKNQGVSWSILGALPRAAIERGDIEMLHQLTKLSRTKRFQCCPELVWNQTLSMKYAIQYGHVKMLQYVAETGTLHSEPNQEESAKIASNLLTWAVKYSNLFESRLELEIIQWVVKKYSHVAFMDVTAQDLSQASIPVLMYLKEKKVATNGFQDPRFVDFVATMGKIKTLRFLCDSKIDQDPTFRRCTSNAMDGAAANGHLDIVQYLHDHRTEGCTTAAMDRAAQNGHMDVVQFLHTRRIEGCTVAAMDGAARSGHLDIVTFLHTSRREGCTTAAMDGAAAGGFLDVVRFLHQNRNEGCTTKAMDEAARSGHLEMVKFLHAQRKEGCTTDAMDGAALVGRLSIITFLHENRKEGCTTKAIDGAAWRGHLDVVRFLVANRSDGCSFKAMDTACQNGYVEIMRVLHEQGNAPCTTVAMDSAASGGHLEIVKYLQENRVEGCTKDAMTNAAINGHADVVCFLGEHRQEGPHEFALERAAALGNADCVEALIRCSIRGCLFGARLAALQAGHSHVVAILSAWMNPDVRTCSLKLYHVRSGPRWCQRQSHFEHLFEPASLNVVKKEQHLSFAKHSGWWWRFRWL